MGLLDEAIVERMRTYLLTEQHLTKVYSAMTAGQSKAMDAVRDQLRVVKEELTQARQRLDNLYEVIEKGSCDIGDLGERVRERKAQAASLEATKEQLEYQLSNPLPTTINSERLREAVEQLQGILVSNDVAAKKELLRRLVRKITVTWEEPQWKISLKYSFPAPMLLNAGNGVPDLDKVGRAFVTDTKCIREIRGPW